MSELPPDERRRARRRRITDDGKPYDRRSGEDRRRGQRRQEDIPVEVERRSGEDRRKSERRDGIDRRVMEDRRRYTPMEFSRDEVNQIRKMILEVGLEVTCPLCGDELKKTSLGDDQSGTTTWELYCPSCRRSYVVEGFRPDPPGE